MVTRLRSRGDRSGRLHISPNSTSSVSVASPGAIRGCTSPEGLAVGVMTIVGGLGGYRADQSQHGERRREAGHVCIPWG